MSKVVSKNTKIRTIINDTLKAFFSVGDEADKNDSISISVDSVDVDILTDALDQALEKERNDENSNKFEQ